MLVYRMGRTIWVSDSESKALELAKANFQRLTGLRTSWGAFLVAISVGALAAPAITGLKLACPNCEHEMRMTITQLRVVEDGDPAEGSPSSSRERTGLYR